MSLETVTLFSGCGLKALGARQAGYSLVGAVEYNEAIASVYADNLGPCVTVGKVEEVSPLPYVGIDALLASPVCTRASVANANRGESEVDLAAAECVCHWLRVTRPKCYVMENVTQYRAFESYRRIMSTLYELGYLCTDDTCNAADYGVPQTRRRMIVRALLGQMPPPLKPTHYNPLAVSEDGGLFAEDTRGMTPWVGWYAAIEDILHTLPESKFADWQLKRLPALFTDTLVRNGNSSVESRPKDVSGSRVHSVEAASPTPCISTGINLRAFLCGVQGEGGDLYRDGGTPSPTVTTAHASAKYRAFLIEGDAAGDRPPTCGTSAEPAFTLKTAGGGRVHRAFLTDGFNAGRPATVLAPERPAMTITAAAMRRPVSPAQAWLEQGHIVSMTPRALARFMSCPDTYRLPESKKLASTVLGNGVPVLLAQRIMEQLKEYLL